MIAPAIDAARAAGIDARGPHPGRHAFVPERLRDADCVLAMYHDQGLPVLKYASFGHGVNVTLGLPFVRTSVDHGTALDLAAAARPIPAACIEAAASSPSSSHRGHARGPRKRFGQHFLHDPRVLARIVEAIAPAPGDRLVEIGPGEGALTRRCCARSAHCTSSSSTATSRRASQKRLRRRLDSASTPTRCEFDFGALPGAAAARGRQPALQHLHAAPVPPGRATPTRRDMHFMLQKEVVERMAAAPRRRLRAAVGDAAGALSHGAAVRRRPARSGRRRRSSPRWCA